MRYRPVGSNGYFWPKWYVKYFVLFCCLLVGKTKQCTQAKPEGFTFHTSHLQLPGWCAAGFLSPSSPGSFPGRVGNPGGSQSSSHAGGPRGVGRPSGEPRTSAGHLLLLSPQQHHCSGGRSGRSCSSNADKLRHSNFASMKQRYPSIMLTAYSADARIPLAGLLRYTETLKEAIRIHGATTAKPGQWKWTTHCRSKSSHRV